MTMHDRHLQFALAQAGRHFTGEQAAPDHDDHFFRKRHLAQSQRVSSGSQINHIAQSDAGDMRPHGPAAHRETRFLEFNRLAIPKDREAAVDIELRHHRPEACLDLVRLVPAFIHMGQLLHRRGLVAEELF